jgi:hypothetical protein
MRTYWKRIGNERRRISTEDTIDTAAYARLQHHKYDSALVPESPQDTVVH